MGQLVRTKVAGGGFMEWVAAGIAALPGYTSEPAPTEVDVAILKAYIQGISTMKSANMVVRVTIASSGKADRKLVYRGVDNTVNWNSTESEVQEAFDRAMSDLQRQMGADLAKSCQA
ncbi:MAG: hypothetical protein U1F53_22505 [Burkholderiaceae bacterium]